jgi:hypothetical protein
MKSGLESTIGELRVASHSRVPSRIWRSVAKKHWHKSASKTDRTGVRSGVMHAFQINEPVDRPKHVDGRHVPRQRELMENCRLIGFVRPSWLHPRLRCLSESALPTVHKLEFFNAICHKQTSLFTQSRMRSNSEISGQWGAGKKDNHRDLEA